MYIAGKFSLSRTVQQGLNGERTAIMNFRTQHRPILHALAHIAVLKPLADRIENNFVDETLHPSARHGLGGSLKSISVQLGQRSLANMSERDQIMEMEVCSATLGHWLKDIR